LHLSAGRQMAKYGRQQGDSSPTFGRSPSKTMENQWQSSATAN